MTTPKRPPRSGANRRGFKPARDVIDQTVWARPERQPARITLPETSINTVTVTDDDLGLPSDLWSQRAAGRALLAAHARHRKVRLAPAAAAGTGIDVTNASVPADAGSAVPVDPDEHLSSDDALILVELERIAARPVPSWMSEKRSAA